MKEVIERCNWLVNKCTDKAITPDVKDDVRHLLEEISYKDNIIINLEKWLYDELNHKEYGRTYKRYIQVVIDKLNEMKENK